MQNLQSMEYKYSFTDDTTCAPGPQKLQWEYKNAVAGSPFHLNIVLHTIQQCLARNC